MKLLPIISALTALPAGFALPTRIPATTRVVKIREDTTLSLSPVAFFEKRQSCAETCGNICYYQSTLDRAVTEGYQLYQSGNQDGNYPHTFNNYEGFDFGVSGPHQEFPVMSDFDAYDGGSPGADRVIFTTRGQYVAAITHNGASGNSFVECD